MIPLLKVSEFAYSKINNVEVTRNGTHFLGRCPLCGDSKKNKRKKRFNLNWNNGMPIYHCFNCGESGNFIELYSRLYDISYQEARSCLLSYDNVDFKNVFKNNVIDDKNKTEDDRSDILYYDDILNDCISLKDETNSIIETSYKNKILDFYKERNVKNYDIFFSYKGEYQGRFIVPIWDNGHIIFFQGRSANGKVPKYKNAETSTDNIILNKDKFKSDKYIIITEGVFDALSIGDQGTTSFGSNVKDDRIEKLLKYTDKGVIIAMDNDKVGIKETFRIIHQSKFSNVLKYLNYPSEFNIYKDINMISHDVKDIYGFIVSNACDGFEYSVKLKIGGNMKK